MADDSLKTRVQNTLVSLARSPDAYFRPVVYNDHGYAQVPLNKTIRPASVLVNEESKELQTDRLYGRSFKQQVSNWEMQLILKFDAEVSCDAFEELLADTIIVPRDDEAGHRQVSLVLRDIDYEHPPRQGSGGTRVTYLFDVDIERN